MTLRIVHNTILPALFELDEGSFKRGTTTQERNRGIPPMLFERMSAKTPVDAAEKRQDWKLFSKKVDIQFTPPESGEDVSQVVCERLPRIPTSLRQ